MRQRLKVLLAVVLVVVAVAALTACGGGGGGGSSSGGGGTTYAVYGTAAAGAPIAGVVNIKGANGATASTTIELDGSYGFTEDQLAGLTKPYMLFAQGNVNGKSASIFSATAADGRINITPITDFIIRTALAMAAETAYANFTTNAGAVTASTLSSAEATVQAKLQPALDAAGVGSADLMSGQFSADHSGIDKVLDIVSISYSGAGTTATVTNNVTGSSFTDNVTTSSDDTNKLPTTDTIATQAALSEEAAINNIFSSMCQLYATARPTNQVLTSWASANVASDYLDQGENREQMVSSWTVDNEGPSIGCTMTATISAALTGITPTYAKGYSVAIIYKDPSFTGSYNFESQVVYNGAKWLWYGDRTWVERDIASEAHRSVSSTGTTFYSGIQMWINDLNSYAYNHGVRSAVVSVTVGTIQGHVVLANQFPQTWYSIQSGCSVNNYGNHCWLNDAIIGQLTDYMPYTLKLCAEAAASLVSNPAACTALQTYTGAIGKKPLLVSQLNNSYFPTLTTPSSLSRNGMGWNDGYVQLAWTNPASGRPVDHVQLGWWDGMNNLRSEQDVTSTTTSVNLDMLGTLSPPQQAWLWLSSWSDDGVDIQFTADWQFDQP